MSHVQLTGLFIYPVKSLRGCATSSTAVDELGLLGDRRFLVVDESGCFLTQRTLPRMALIDTALSRDDLTLSAAGAGSCRVARVTPPGMPPIERQVSIWKSEGLIADDCGDEVAQWLAGFLGVRCRLVRIGRKFSRPVLKPGKARPDDRVMFADAYPLMILSEASLADVNDRLVARGDEPVPMNRFRPNLVVAGCAAFAEDTWGRFRIGSVTFRAGGPCARCVVTTTDQSTAERGHEPLRLLATYRRDAQDPTRLNFGHNLFHETKAGTLQVGDSVEVLEDATR